MSTDDNNVLEDHLSALNLQVRNKENYYLLCMLLVVTTGCRPSESIKACETNYTSFLEGRY